MRYRITINSMPHQTGRKKYKVRYEKNLAVLSEDGNGGWPEFDIEIHDLQLIIDRYYIRNDRTKVF